MKNKITVLGASAILFVMPIMAMAAPSEFDPSVDSSTAGSGGIGGLITTVGGWIDSLLPIMLTLGVLAFFWGLAKFLFKGGAADKQEGQTIMIWGILAVFIMASIGGIVTLLQSTAQIDAGDKTIKSPCIGKCKG